MNAISIACQGHGVVFPRFDILYGLRFGVACAVQRGNARIIRAGLVAAASMNAKYTHENSSAAALESDNVALFNHVTHSYDCAIKN